MDETARRRDSARTRKALLDAASRRFAQDGYSATTVRDIAEDAGHAPGVFLYDIDDLQKVAEANLRERKKESAAAEAIVEQEVRDFLEWRRSLEVVPLVAELRRRADEIRKAEIAKARQRLGPLTPEQESALEAATSAIVNKLLHAPTVRLKELAGSGQADGVGLVRRLFDL